jgi:superfamily II DNA/RNA helicase
VLQISVLILSPTRELAQQIAEEASQLTKFQPHMSIQARHRPTHLSSPKFSDES